MNPLSSPISTLSQLLNSSLLSQEIERLLAAPLDSHKIRQLGQSLATLHRRFVAEEGDGRARTDYQADSASLAAYLAYFFPSSAAQVARALREIRVEEVFPPSGDADSPRNIRILDVGSGPGPALLAVAAWAKGGGYRVRATAIDASKAALASLTRLWPQELGALNTQVWSANKALPEGKFELIVASHFFNELSGEGGKDEVDGRQLKMAESLHSRLPPGGLLLIVEPALRRTGRGLLFLRDALLANPELGLEVLAPCLMQENCPALSRPRDWCHADRPWDAPSLVNQVGEAAGLSRESLKFSYLLLQKASSSSSERKDESAESDSRFRIVSEALPEKGKLRVFGCGPSGRHALVRLNRDEREENIAFSNLERGDIVSVTGLRGTGEGRRVEKTSRVLVERSAKALDIREDTGADLPGDAEPAHRLGTDPSLAASARADLE